MLAATPCRHANKRPGANRIGEGNGTMKKGSQFSLLLLAIGIANPANSMDAAPVNHSIVARGDVKIEVLSQGKGPAIVIFPSLGRSAGDYDVVSRILAEDGFRILRPQPRGIGDSKGPMDGLTMHDLAADAASVIEHENGGPAIVVGHAFGNFVARQVAADRPDLVAGVVLAAASVCFNDTASTEK